MSSAVNVVIGTRLEMSTRILLETEHTTYRAVLCCKFDYLTSRYRTTVCYRVCPNTVLHEVLHEKALNVSIYR